MLPSISPQTGIPPDFKHKGVFKIIHEGKRVKDGRLNSD